MSTYPGPASARTVTTVLATKPGRRLVVLETSRSALRGRADDAGKRDAAPSPASTTAKPRSHKVEDVLNGNSEDVVDIRAGVIGKPCGEEVKQVLHRDGA